MDKGEKLESKVPQEFKFMLGCTDCGLSKTRRHVVVGRGPIKGVKYMVVGEAPGADEDKEGLPFVGRSGRLLSNLFSQVGIKEDELYITNLIMDRPPDNRKPTGTEVHACSKHLEFKIKVIKPEIIVTVGGSALQYFFTSAKVTTARGKLMTTKKGLKIFPILHPAAALRNTEMIDIIAEDLSTLKNISLEKEAVTIGPRIIRR